MNQFKKFLPTIIAVVVVGGFAFYGGMQYGKSSLSGAPASDTASFRGARGGQGQRGQNGGFLSGSVLSKDNQSITVKTQDGNTHIVFYASSTSVMKPSPAPMSDIAAGTSVTIAGTPNSDGSITAQSIQIRSASSSRQ